MITKWLCWPWYNWLRVPCVLNTIYFVYKTKLFGVTSFSCIKSFNCWFFFNGRLDILCIGKILGLFAFRSLHKCFVHISIIIKCFLFLHFEKSSLNCHVYMLWKMIHKLLKYVREWRNHLYVGWHEIWFLTTICLYILVLNCFSFEYRWLV